MDDAVLVCCLMVGLLATGVVKGDGDCPTVDFVADGCSLPQGLTVTSGHIVLDQKSCNTTYPKAQWQETPKVAFPAANPEDKYALFMIDPDAINTPKGQYYWHWLAANIPGNELKTGEWKQDYSAMSYRGPAPPKGTGLHRYQFVLFRHQDSTKVVTSKFTNQQRPKFHLGEWLNKLAAESQLCGPIAGLQFISQF